MPTRDKEIVPWWPLASPPVIKPVENRWTSWCFKGKTIIDVKSIFFIGRSSIFIMTKQLEAHGWTARASVLAVGPWATSQVAKPLVKPNSNGDVSDSGKIRHPPRLPLTKGTARSCSSVLHTHQSISVDWHAGFCVENSRLTFEL